MMLKARGFTLIELITVLVVLAILATLSSQFIVTSVDSYRDAQIRNRLMAKGRGAIEQMTRYIRASVPNSVRVSASGNCIEALPNVGGAFYIGQVPDSSNGAASISSVATSPFTLDVGAAQHAVIGSFFNSEIYSSASPAARVSIVSTVGTPITAVNFTLPHRFIRNSQNNRIYVTDDPRRFCLSGGNLVMYESYGLNTGALTDASPAGATTVLMATGVNANINAFSVSASSEDRNASADIALVFFEGSIQVALNQTILVRNVP